MRRCGMICLLFCVMSSIAIPAKAVLPTLEVAVYEEAPYQFLDDDGTPIGLLIDLFDAVAGLAGYRAEYCCYGSMRECVAALEDGKVNLVLGVSSAEHFVLSETAELYASPMIIAESGAGSGQLAQQNSYRTVGYGYYVMEPEIVYSMEADRYVIADRSYELVRMLAEHKVDAAIMDKAVLDYAMAGEYQGQEIEVMSNHLDTIKYTAACVPGNSALLRELNTAILNLRMGGNYEEIKARWIPQEEGTDWRPIMTYALMGGSVLLIAFGIYFIINRRIQWLLESELQEKTQDLRHINTQLEAQVKQLRFESELRNKLIKTAHNGMVMVDREERVQLMNQSANRLAGFPVRAEGMLVTQLPCFREVLSQVGEDIFALGNSVENRRIPVQMKDGEPTLIFRLNIQQIVELGQVTGALITLENITEEQRMIQASYEEEKNRALNCIVAGIAHEIKNPLMSIRAYASLIGQKMNDTAFQESFAEFVPRETDRINDLVESLVSYARPAKGMKGHVDLCRLVRECAYLSHLARRKALIEVKIQADGEIYIYANPDHIKQVVINMMINGIEAMEEKMQRFPETDTKFLLSVAVERQEKQVLLTISDNGIGMSQEERQQCTNLFYTTKRRGTGMGLALSEQFILENDGWLEIISKEGEFTRFMISFPIDMPAASEKAGI